MPTFAAGANLMKSNYEYVLGETVGGLAIADFYNLKNSVSSPTSANIRKKERLIHCSET